MLEERIKLERYFHEGFPIKILPKILFVIVLILVYIGNAHYVENTIRKNNRLEIKVEDLRADYTTLKAALMVSGKQSEVAKRVKMMRLKESAEPPYKIIINNEEY